jgi:RNA polymerase sigma-70 factor (ECF subfamily)
MSDSSADLLERARGGDPAALEALLERHRDHIYRFGLKMCRDPEDARDVVQDTLLGMARGIRDFRGASSLSTWIYTIARSFCLKQRRKRRPERLDIGAPLEHFAELPAPGSAPDEALAGSCFATWRG